MTSIIPLTGKHIDKVVTVSQEDFERVSKHKWRLYAGYPYSNDNNKKLHQFIMGPRPDDIPADYVLDHADRDPLNATRQNLRWVSVSFNNWNVALLTSGSSRFKGVSWDKSQNKWAANFQGKKLGVFVIERDAAKVYAKAVITAFPLWAHDSDLLVGPNLLSAAEIQTIITEIDLGTGMLVAGTNLRKNHPLPRGVRRQGKSFSATYCRTSLGTYKTAEEAGRVYEDHVQSIKDAEWAAHLKIPISRDADGDAIIALNGQKGNGLFTKVPDRVWHELTYHGSWYFDGKYAAGAFKGEAGRLHRFVYKLCFPDSILQGSVDHIDASKKLNNLESNLRDATHGVQAYNKEKKAGCSSKYIGVLYDKAKKRWLGKIRHDGNRYNTGHYREENDAARALNVLAKELKGEYARVLEIVE